MIDCDYDAYVADAVEWRVKDLAIQRVQAFFRHYRHSLARGAARLSRLEEKATTAESQQKIMHLRQTIRSRQAWLTWHEGDLEQEIQKNAQLGDSLETRRRGFLEHGMVDPASCIAIVERH